MSSLETLTLPGGLSELQRDLGICPYVHQNLCKVFLARFFPLCSFPHRFATCCQCFEYSSSTLPTWPLSSTTLTRCLVPQRVLPQLSSRQGTRRTHCGGREGGPQSPPTAWGELAARLCSAGTAQDEVESKHLLCASSRPSEVILQTDSSLWGRVLPSFLPQRVVAYHEKAGG